MNDENLTTEELIKRLSAFLWRRVKEGFNSYNDKYDYDKWLANNTEPYCGDFLPCHSSEYIGAEFEKRNLLKNGEYVMPLNIIHHYDKWMVCYIGYNNFTEKHDDIFDIYRFDIKDSKVKKEFDEKYFYSRYVFTQADDLNEALIEMYQLLNKFGLIKE